MLFNTTCVLHTTVTHPAVTTLKVTHTNVRNTDLFRADVVLLSYQVQSAVIPQRISSRNELIKVGLREGQRERVAK